MSKVKKAFYRIERSGFGKKLRFALVSDLHGEDPQDVIQIIKEERPDYILCPGDIFERLDGSRNFTYTPDLKEAKDRIFDEFMKTPLESFHNLKKQDYKKIAERMSELV